MEIALIIVGTIVLPFLVLWCANSSMGDFERIEALMKKRGGRDVKVRINPFSRCWCDYVVDYLDSKGVERSAYCHIELFSGRIFFGEKYEERKDLS